MADGYTCYKEEIKRLLTPMESLNENEVKATLLKARQIMAEHKIMETKGLQHKVKDVLTDVSCSRQRNPWIMDLADLVGEYYCCQGYMSHKPGKQTQYIGFVGLEDDVEICMVVFKYALDCALSGIKHIRKENDGCESGYIKQFCDSYGYGFAAGIEAALEKQREEKGDGWESVLSLPEEVVEATRNIEKKDIVGITQEDISGHEYMAGYEQGQRD